MPPCRRAYRRNRTRCCRRGARRRTPRRGVGRERDDAVDAGRLAHRAADRHRARAQTDRERVGAAQRPALLDEDADRLPAPLRPRPLRGTALRVAQPQQPAALLAFRDLTGQLGPRRALLARIDEKTHTIKFGTFDPALQLGDVLVGLARKADDERRAHRDAGDAPAEIVDDLEIPLAVRRPQHRAQHRRADVLQRHVHVRADLRQRSHGIDELRVDGRGIEIEQPDPADPVDVVQPVQQMREPAAPEAAVASPHRGVLRDEDQLAHAGRRERARLGEDRLLAARAEAAAQLRDDAERARMIAAFGDLQVRGGRRRRDEPRQKVVLGLRFEIEPYRPLARARVVEQLDDRGVRAGADDAVDLGNQRLQLFAEALRETAGDDELLTRALALGMREDRLGRLRLRRIDERTGVDDDRVRLIGLRDQRPAGCAELGDHHFGVDQVLRAAKRDKGDRALARRGRRSAPRAGAPRSPIVHELERQLELQRFQHLNDFLQVVLGLR